MPESAKRKLSLDVDFLEADPPLIDLDTPPVTKKPRRVRWGANQTVVFHDMDLQSDNGALLLMHDDRSQDLDETLTTEVASGSSSSVTLVHDRGIAQQDNLPESDATTSAGTPSLAAIPGTADTAATVTGALGVEQSSDFVSDSESDDALLTDIAPLMARIERKLLKRKRGRASAASATVSYTN
ncbi:hypothetical protein A1Q1_00437 [Trichosporon asahii var. asahii CBS 2479]|uniref:Uncharacterized protein n=1 Tax=Trichosporon asahii var. asahii (strain ATCC 90039 / CBS 2479 / JCM 2466 / KCTC 7840 / NBRC 103889/ NCYC 2677 / UAMH 7654) TaxID=1186058 RepID=J6F023_TRIAS|nr:hypothetical protein A1Q1_00437 [Trichosporon asahii var. asahii CBS 2479]EJT50279.1 hypothetical protein A1Q1_00437 [Trichosporon asahii var. asahii CBS 2479]